MLIVLIAVSLLIQSYGIFAMTYAAAWDWRVPFNVAAPCAMNSVRRTFSSWPWQLLSGCSGWARVRHLPPWWAVLVEVPVMLSLVAFANATCQRFSEA